MNKTTTALGKNAEYIACNFLQIQGYEILKQNYRSPFGEIDIIVRKEETETLVACEVKFRTNKNILPYVISIKQQQRIMSSLLYFCQNNINYSRYNLRCDALLVDRNNNIKHIENAWEE